jgi:DNA mismatch repair ATPase MutS
MLENRFVAGRVIHFLQKSHDSKRLVQKFTLGRGDADDLLALAATIRATHDLLLVLQRACNIEGQTSGEALRCLTSISDRIELDEPKLVAEQIQAAIDEDGLAQQHSIADQAAASLMDLAEQVASEEGSAEDVAAVTKKNRKRKRTVAVDEIEDDEPQLPLLVADTTSESAYSAEGMKTSPKRGRKRPSSIKEHYGNDGDVWTMRPAASTVLQRLHHKLNGLMDDKCVLSANLKTRLGASMLTLRWSPGLGHICHVKGKGRDTLDTTEMRIVSSSRSTRSFHHPEWTALGQRIDEVKIQIRAEEQQVFLGLREQVILNLVKLRRNAVVLDELDIACSFATLAEEQNLVRPILNNSVAHKIVGGRHPTVQGGLREQGRSFVANDCFVGDQERIWLITGPNMAGKSTFLRQNALITIMAQVGSYVPAEYAEIGIVDQIFSRVGSADNLFRDQSTFMVEMLETAAILKNATPHSFVIMDEIGRGTTPEDGTAIAFACLHHLYHVNRCRTLFATHFHALASMSNDLNGIGYYCTDVEEDNLGGFSYMHKISKGVNKKSHALKVAKLAGVPEAAIEVARLQLSKM